MTPDLRIEAEMDPAPCPADFLPFRPTGRVSLLVDGRRVTKTEFLACLKAAGSNWSLDTLDDARVIVEAT